jgi:hypothetical protein
MKLTKSLVRNVTICLWRRSHGELRYWYAAAVRRFRVRARQIFSWLFVGTGVWARIEPNIG